MAHVVGIGAVQGDPSNPKPPLGIMGHPFRLSGVIGSYQGSGSCCLGGPYQPLENPKIGADLKSCSSTLPTCLGLSRPDARYHRVDRGPQ